MARALSNSKLNPAKQDEGLVAVGDAAQVRHDAIKAAALGVGDARTSVDSSGNAISNQSGLTQAEKDAARKALQ